MTLTGSTVQSTYKDLVQLEQSGAGLPSHAGANANLYDGDGNRIIARTYREHWLNPDPLATGTPTEECLTDKSWATMSGEGWVKSGANVAASIANGWCKITESTGNTWGSLYFPVNLTGDFDIWCSPFTGVGYGTYNTMSYFPLFIGVADSTADGGNGLLHMIGALPTVWHSGFRTYASSTLATGPDDGVSANGTAGPGWGSCILRLVRSSGTLYLGGTSFGDTVVRPDLGDFSFWERCGWVDGTSVADASTYDRLYLFFQNELNGGDSQTGFRFIRRYS